MTHSLKYGIFATHICSSPGARQWGQSTPNVITSLSSDGLASMFELTREQPFLRAAEEAADYASLYQAHFEPTFIDRPKVAYVFGGMRSQNTDAEWLDMRQAVISEGFMRLGEHRVSWFRLCTLLLACSLAPPP